MKITYMNNHEVLVHVNDIDPDEEYDLRAIVEEAMGVKTARDFISFLEHTPAPFFFRFLSPMPSDYIHVGDLLYQGNEYFFKGSIEESVEKSFLDIDLLDELVINAGELGEVYEHIYTYPDDHPDVSVKSIHPNGQYHSMYLGSAAMLVENVRSLAIMAAIACGERASEQITRIATSCDKFAQFIDSGLTMYTDFNDPPNQLPEYSTYFTADENKLLAKEIGDGKGDTAYQVAKRELPSARGLFVYPLSFSDEDIAVNIFTSFMNTLFEGNAAAFYAGNTFKVDHNGRDFIIRHPRSPFRDMYFEIAKAASDRNIRLCSWCGSPMLSDKSRGNEAMYCSRSCNTKASNARRETAYALAASGAPVEEAIAKIGERYSDSIARWYKEAKALLD